jgi:hypothetical protein
MRDLFNWLLLVVIVCACFAAIVDFGLNAVDRVNKVECMKWREEAWTMPDYFLLEWQVKQCNFLGVYVAAPVK